MDDNKKLVINTTGEKLELSNGYIELEDSTARIFDTESPEDFIKFLNNGDFNKTAQVFYNERVAAAHFISDPNQKTHPIAVCHFENEDIMYQLKELNGKPLSLDALIATLSSLRDYSSQETLRVIDQLNDLSIKKVISIDRQKDDRGNFNYGIKSEKHGKQDYEFPKNLTFEIPVIRFVEEKIKIDFVFQFNYIVDSNGSFDLSFNFKNINLDSIVKKMQKEIISKTMQDFKGNSYFGSVTIVKQTNEWKYKINGIKGL